MGKDRNWGVRPNAKERMEGAQERDGEELPSYRFYGMRRYVKEWKEKLGLFFGRACVFLLFAVYAFIVGLAGYAFFVYFPELWIKVLVAVLVAILVVLHLTKKMRQRRKFCRRIKRACKESRARLSLRPKFIRSAAWQKDREDFRIEAGLRVFYVHYLTVPKYNTSVYLEKPGEIKVVKKPLNNKFTMIFNKKPKVTVYSTEMKTPALEGRRVIRAVVIDPECQSVYCVQKDGGYEATGNGGVHFGTTVYTVKGFCETLKYDSLDSRKEIRY